MEGDNGDNDDNYQDGVTISSHMFYLTFVFFYEYTRGCYALNGRVTFSRLAYLVFPFPVPHATGSCTRTFPFPFTCSLTCTNVDYRLVSGYLFFPHFSFCYVNSSLCLTLLLMPFPL